METSSSLRSLTERATSAEKRAQTATNQLALLEARIAEVQQKAGTAEDKWEARVREYENRLRVAGEKIKTEKQGGKERARELEARVRSVLHPFPSAQHTSAPGHSSGQFPWVLLRIRANNSRLRMQLTCGPVSQGIGETGRSGQAAESEGGSGRGNRDAPATGQLDLFLGQRCTMYDRVGNQSSRLCPALVTGHVYYLLDGGSAALVCRCMNASTRDLVMPTESTG